MDFPQVEPIDGPEIDRLVTALLNASGVMHRIVESTPAFESDGYDADGLTVMAQAAQRTRTLLAQVVEHHGDEELAYIRQFLAVLAVVLAHGIGQADIFRRPPG